MGLGIRIRAEIKPRGILRRKVAPSDVFRSIAESIPKLMGHPLHVKLARITVDEQGVAARLHPAEEPVEFRIDESGMLTVSAKTSSAGPGYHAFLIDLLDRLGEQCSLGWIWDDEEKEYLDETGYAGSRDFSKLQCEMARFLRALSGMLIEKEEGLNYALAMPIGFGLTGDYFAISSLGYWDRAWFDSAAKASDEVLVRHSSDFFPWWGKERDAEFWLRCGLVKSWVDLPWHPPVDERERDDFRTTIECFHVAKQLDSAIRQPDRELAEMEHLLSESAMELPPNPDGIGFTRRSMRKRLTGKWSIKVPGYYYESNEEDGQTVTYWFGDRTVSGSSFEATKKQCDAGEKDPVSHERTLRFTEEHLTGSADIKKAEEDGRSFWILQGVVSMKTIATKASVCVVSICFEDPEDRDWAVETWKSVYRDPEEEEP